MNALYGYTPEFLEIYAQVGAAASELNIYKENSVVNGKYRNVKRSKYYGR